MAMKSVLVALEEPDGQEALLETALLTARIFASIMNGLFVHPIRTNVVAGGSEGVVAASLDLMQHYERQDSDRAGNGSPDILRLHEGQGRRNR